MDLVDTPVPLTEAVKYLMAKKLMPTSLDSGAIRDLDAALRRQSFFSAQTTNQFLLGKYRALIASILDPAREVWEGGEHPATVGYNQARARSEIKGFLASVGYTAPEGKAGTIEDLSSDSRINLVIDTNVRMAIGAGRFIQANEPEAVEKYPAWRFRRVEERLHHRMWEGSKGLWANACRRAGDRRALAAYGDTGRMAALKSSGVWEEISDPDYTPGGLGNPFDPVALNTGMGREELSRAEAVELGLLGEDDDAQPTRFGLPNLFSLPGTGSAHGQRSHLSNP